MSGMKLRNVHRPQRYYKQSMSDDSDGEWKPDNPQKSSSSSDERYMGQKLSFQESGESDEGNSNDCPICRKSFSRSAALICHIKQNHSYMLSKQQGKDSTVDSMKEEVLEWKNRMCNGKAHSVNTSLEADSDDEASSGNNNKSRGRVGDVDKDSDNKFPIIGGSAVSDGDESVRTGGASTSILSFDSANDELLDPDQSFCIVRRGLKKSFKTKDSRKRISSVTEEPVQSTKKKVALDFASIDFSIDNSAEDLKLYECFVCDMSFSSSSLLTYHHMRKHMTNDCQQCPKCGSVFYDPSLFTAHCNSYRCSKGRIRKIDY